MSEVIADADAKDAPAQTTAVDPQTEPTSNVGAEMQPLCVLATISTPSEGGEGGDNKEFFESLYKKLSSLPFPLFSIEYKIDLTHLTNLTIVIE